ncbi:MAG: nuclear transport factor 2 family protein [Sphingobium sp.]|nr:nuclear transport factor 2 family protein [Sphingobium sp.]
MNYADYVADFNTGDDTALVDKWFAPDCVMNSTGRVVEGRDGMKAFLAWAHDGVREIVRPRVVMHRGKQMFVDVDMDFVCSVARPDFPFGALLPGDIMTVRFFVTYKLDANGQIAELNSMTWPAERGVIKAPMLSASAGGRASYEAYAAAFSAGDMERAGRYYTEDCTLDLPNLPRFEGKAAILSFYGKMFERVREALTIHHLTMDDDGIAVECTSTFTAQVDAPEFVVAPLKKGESVQTRVLVHYALREGRICRIKVARAG